MKMNRVKFLANPDGVLITNAQEVVVVVNSDYTNYA
jgi:hypothetical protein